LHGSVEFLGLARLPVKDENKFAALGKGLWEALAFYQEKASATP
jgi:hypothetical protein